MVLFFGTTLPDACINVFELTLCSQVSVSALFQWSSIFISHIRFRRGLAAQGISTRTLPFRDWTAPYAQYLGLLVVLFIAGCEFYLACFPFDEQGSAKTWFSSYIAAPLFFLDYFGYKVSIRRLKDLETLADLATRFIIAPNWFVRQIWTSRRLMLLMKRTGQGRPLAMRQRVGQTRGLDSPSRI